MYNTKPYKAAIFIIFSLGMTKAHSSDYMAAIIAGNMAASSACFPDEIIYSMVIIISLLFFIIVGVIVLLNILGLR